jgi:multidrug efflux pump subunit AcrB
MLPQYAIENRTFVGFIVALVIGGGVWSYFSMGRLEDPEFTIRTAFVVTAYPGASAEDVDQQVTKVVERYVWRVDGVEKVRSISRPGMSITYVDLRRDFPVAMLKHAWQELRNKVSSTRLELPVESLPPQVHDDFGDVFGIILALSGDGYSHAELKEHAKILQRELQTVEQVSRVELCGVQNEVIEVNISRSRMAELQIAPAQIVLAFARQNIQSDAGQMTLGNSVSDKPGGASELKTIRIAPSGNFESLEEIGNLIIPSGDSDDILKTVAAAASGGTADNMLFEAVLPRSSVLKQPIRLRDIATIRRCYADPPNEIVRSNGVDAVAIAISPISGGNVIRMGTALEKRIKEVMQDFPAGFHLDYICYQPDNVTAAIRTFEKNLYEAVIIVTVVVMISMGWRSGILITCSLLVVILATLCVLQPLGIILNRTSLGAFIIALGILVDDAVVVGDMILVNMQRGMNRKDACTEGARHVGTQLLGATIVGALAFLPVYLSPDDTGEYCRDLFIVIAVSLTISWIVAMVQTPVLYYQFVKPFSRKAKSGDPHSGAVFRIYRNILEWTLHHKTVAFIILAGAMLLAGFGFTKVDQTFFPPAQRTQMMIEYHRESGTSINSVAEDMREIEKYVMAQPGVTQIASFIGSGPPRFYLPYTPEIPTQNYGMLIVNVTSISDVDKLIVPMEAHLKKTFPQGWLRAFRFMLGPMTANDIEVRFSGHDETVLHQLADQAKNIFSRHQNIKDIADDWREQILVWTPVYSQAKGNQTLLGRSDMNTALRWATLGIPVSTYHQLDTQLPILLRGTPGERNDFANIRNIPVWGSSNHSVPLGQVIKEGTLTWQEPQIHRYNGVKTITAFCNPIDGVQWRTALNELSPELDAIELPDGYTMQHGGQIEKSLEAEGTLLAYLPITLILMAVIVVGLFNSLQQPVIVMLTFPLILIGITFGLLVTRLPFGFMALVGTMSLLGMCVRNAVVLMSQIDTELAKGLPLYESVVQASVERFRPVTVAAMTVVVGMIPLLRDPLFNSMAAAIMFGLIFATALTLLFVPMLYMLFRKR